MQKTGIEAKSRSWVLKIVTAKKTGARGQAQVGGSTGILDRLKKMFGGKTSSSYEDAHGLQGAPNNSEIQGIASPAKNGEKNIPFVPRFVNDELRSVQRIDPKLNLTPEKFFSNFSKDLGLSLGPEGSEMAVLHSEKEETGQIDPIQKTPVPVEWTNYEQKYRGLKVLGTGYTLRVQNGLVSDAIGKVIGGLKDLEIAPKIPPEEASKAAGTWKAEEETKTPPPPVSSPELAISTRNYSMKTEDAALVWVISFPDETVEINAQTGERWNRVPSIVEADDPGGTNILANGTALFKYGSSGNSDNVSFVARKKNDGTSLLGTYKQDGGTLPFSVDISLEDCRLLKGGTELDLDKPDCEPIIGKNDPPSFADPSMKEGVSLLWSAQNFLSFLAGAFKNLDGTPWVGMDGRGATALKMTVKDPLPGGANYSGGGTTAYGKPRFDFDIVGHEMAHGIVGHTVKLINQGETGAINEGIADIMAVLAHQSRVPEMEGLKWKFSWEGVPPNGMRQLDTPLDSGQPAQYHGMNYGSTKPPCGNTNDWCYVHKNSSIVSHWFYLLTDIGMEIEDAQQILFDVLRYRLVSPTAQFMDLRNATILAAERRFPDDSMKAYRVQKAWHEVGIGEDRRNYLPDSGTNHVLPWKTVFQWSALEGEKLWQIEVATDPGFHEMVKREWVTETAVAENPDGGADPGPFPSGELMARAEFNLKPNHWYYWHIRPADEAERVGSLLAEFTGVRKQTPKTKSWGDTQGVSTDALLPHIVKPAQMVTVEDCWKTEFRWDQPIAGANVQQYQIDVFLSEEGCGGDDEKAEDFIRESLPGITQIVPASEGTMSLEMPLKPTTGNECYIATIKPIGPDSLWDDFGIGSFSLVTFTAADTRFRIDSPVQGATINWTKPSDWQNFPVTWINGHTNVYKLFVPECCPLDLKPGNDIYKEAYSKQQGCAATPFLINGDSVTLNQVNCIHDNGPNTVVVAEIAQDQGCLAPINGPGSGSSSCVLGQVSDPVTFNFKWVAVCGDGIKGPNEACDDGNFNGQPNHCNAACNGGTPSFCGNGVKEAGEPCDDGSLNGQPNHCDTACTGSTPPSCGNGIKEAGEQCDDKNTAASDGCSPNCQIEPKCGNGVIEQGEQCDGSNLNGATCPSGYTGSPTCTAQCALSTSACQKAPQNCTHCPTGYIYMGIATTSCTYPDTTGCANGAAGTPSCYLQCQPPDPESGVCPNSFKGTPCTLTLVNSTWACIDHAPVAPTCQ